MSSGTATRRIGRGLRTTVVLAVLALTAALAAGAWWAWGQRPAPPATPVPPDPSSADPDVTAGFAARAQRVLREPQSAAAWGAYGQVLLANGCSAEAALCLVQAEKLDPTEPRWPYLRGWDLMTTDRAAAVQALRRAADLSDQPGEAAAAPWLLLADMYMEIDDREQVEACCRRVLEREPENARAHFDLGLIAFMHDDLDICISHLLRAANSPAVRQHAFTQLAAAYQRQRNETEAAKYARLAQQAPPDAPWRDPFVSDLDGLKLGRETRYRQLAELGSQGRLAEQAALLRRMAEEHDDARTNLDLGIVLTEQKAFEEAEAVLRKAASLDPRSPDPSYFLGVALYRQGEQKEQSADDDFRAAADAFRRATALKPDYALAYYYLGLTLQKVGSRAEAIDSLRTAARCRPEMVDIQLELGKALAADGQQGEAEAHLREACELAPDDARPRAELERIRVGPMKK